jgi:hypothetical protein
MELLHIRALCFAVLSGVLLYQVPCWSNLHVLAIMLRCIFNDWCKPFVAEQIWVGLPVCAPRLGLALTLVWRSSSTSSVVLQA